MYDSAPNKVNASWETSLQGPPCPSGEQDATSRNLPAEGSHGRAGRGPPASGKRMLCGQMPSAVRLLTLERIGHRGPAPEGEPAPGGLRGRRWR